MPVVNIPGNGGEKIIKTSGLYLSIISSSGVFTIENPAFSPLVGKTGRQFELPASISQVTLKNDSGNDISVEFESSNIRVTGSGSGVVEVDGSVVVSRIEEAIQVNATSTVEDGKVSQLMSNTINPLPPVSIAFGQTVQVAPANNKVNRTIVTRIVSATETTLRLGNSASFPAGYGISAKGSIDEPGEFVIPTTAAVYLRNESADAATIEVLEMYRA